MLDQQQECGSWRCLCAVRTAACKHTAGHIQQQHPHLLLLLLLTVQTPSAHPFCTCPAVLHPLGSRTSLHSLLQMLLLMALWSSLARHHLQHQHQQRRQPLHHPLAGEQGGCHTDSSRVVLALACRPAAPLMCEFGSVSHVLKTNLKCSFGWRSHTPFLHSLCRLLLLLLQPQSSTWSALWRPAGRLHLGSTRTQVGNTARLQQRPDPSRLAMQSCRVLPANRCKLTNSRSRMHAYTATTLFLACLLLCSPPVPPSHAVRLPAPCVRRSLRQQQVSKTWGVTQQV